MKHGGSGKNVVNEQKKKKEKRTFEAKVTCLPRAYCSLIGGRWSLLAMLNVTQLQL